MATTPVTNAATCDDAGARTKRCATPAVQHWRAARATRIGRHSTGILSITLFQPYHRTVGDCDAAAARCMDGVRTVACERHVTCRAWRNICACDDAASDVPCHHARATRLRICLRRSQPPAFPTTPPAYHAFLRFMDTRAHVWDAAALDAHARSVPPPTAFTPPPC